MYGGASASRESLNMSIISSASKPRVTNVKPVSRQGSERDTIGTSALRILRALEQISSPVSYFLLLLYMKFETEMFSKFS